MRSKKIKIYLFPNVKLNLRKVTSTNAMTFDCRRCDWIFKRLGF